MYNNNKRWIISPSKVKDVITIVFAPPANLPIGNSSVFAPLALLCFIMASLTLEGSKISGFLKAFVEF
jgi:hypothetical protein